MKLVAFLMSLFLVGPVFANKTITIKGTLAEKPTCQPGLNCLPKALSSPQSITLIDPEPQSFSQADAIFKNYLVVFTLTKRSGDPSYYSFQVEISDLISGQPIALCSRYERVVSFEKNLVGACMGQAFNSNSLIGVTLSLPDVKNP